MNEWDHELDRIENGEWRSEDESGLDEYRDFYSSDTDDGNWEENPDDTGYGTTENPLVENLTEDTEHENNDVLWHRTPNTMNWKKRKKRSRGRNRPTSNII